MSTQLNIDAGLEQLNDVTGNRYAIRNEGTDYVLLFPNGEYPARSAQAIRETLLNLTIAANGRTR